MKGIIATDGSTSSREAAKAAEELLRSDMEFVIATVVPEREDPMAFAGGFEGPLMTEEEADEMAARADDAGQNAILHAAEDLETPDETGEVPVVSAHLLHDDNPGEALCRLAAEEKADVIVISASEKGLLRRLLEGSVVSHVLKHAPCPVLVVRH